MIDYKLAKELKDSGFPLRRQGVGFACDVLHIGFAIDGIEYYSPTLSELIDACGVGFDSLTTDSRGKRFSSDIHWYAKGNMTIHTSGRKSKGGKTPEEAVARLYIALNEKK